MAASNEVNFRCRKCRLSLFATSDLSIIHSQKIQCMSWYLRDDDGMLPWVQALVDESGWTEGKLYCPKCKGRVGGFDFLHVVQCACMEDVIPAIWCPKSRVDKISNVNVKGGNVKGAQTGDGEDESSNNGDDSSPRPEISRNSDTRESGSAVKNVNGEKEDIALEPKCQSADDQYVVCEARRTRSISLENITGFSADDTFDKTVYTVGKVQGLQSQNSYVLNENNSFYVRNGKEKIESGAKDILKTCNVFKHHHSCSTTPKNVCHCCRHCYCTKHETKHPPQCIAHTDCNGSNMCCESVTHIHESIKEIRREIVDLYSARTNDKEMGQKNRRKPRRRGRGNWQLENDYIAAMRDAKKDAAVENQDCIAHKVAKTSRKRADYVIDEDKEFSDSEIPDCYKCSVCLSLLHRPQRTPCQHVFCGICVKQLNHVSRGRPKCPLCREPIRSVEAEEEMEAEIQISFPVNYRKRAKEARKNRHRRAALPTPQTTMFDSEEQPAGQEASFQIVHHLSVIALIISVVINSFVINANGNAVLRVELRKKLAIFLIIVFGIMFALLIIMFLFIFALDFVKIALLMVLSYVAMTKLVLNGLLE